MRNDERGFARGLEWMAAVADSDKRGEPTSLMTSDRIRSTLAAAGPDLVFDGLKVSTRQIDGQESWPLALIESALEAMRPA